MPLVVDQLQLWTIGFKWAGLDPSRQWLRIPEEARDNFSTLLEAIVSDHLSCMSLLSEKYTGDDPELAKYHIRYWIDEVYAAIYGQHFNRKLLKHAVIDRYDFKDWCERRTIPLPEFWFPAGWTDYRWPAEDLESASEDSMQDTAPSAEEKEVTKLRPSHVAKLTCQQIAKAIWREHPETTIASMSKHDLILKYGGGLNYSEEVVRRWVKEVAPAEVSAKRGRPPKNNPTLDE